MPAPEVILDLVARFRDNEEAYRHDYGETETRREFLDPFFKALGWDIDNTQGHAEAYKDVVHEDSVKVGISTKAPDYSFRVGGVRKFFLEAKNPAVNIKEESDPAFQLRRYAWSAKLSLSILSNFAEFAVYDCRVKPKQGDKAGAARTMYFTYDDYAAQWDEIAAVFSKDALYKGSFDKYAAGKGKKGTAEVDEAFLEEIERWRDSLAHNIALRNSKLTQPELNFAVQQTIDRIIFLRICEDRGIEHYGRLHGLLNGENIYARLKQLFHDADDRYNSGLFHFREEKGRPHPDELTLQLKIDDRVLKDILGSLYYPASPYEFSVLPADILGQVYEQFLGKVIRLTARGHAKIEEKPEVKKAGGVYYTPTYIVDYIVKHTVGKLVEGGTPEKVAKLRILDPACGSGSFLLGAYQYLLDWHRDWYSANEPEKHARGRPPRIFKGAGGGWRLTTAERKRILLNNIYGVDIDTQAAEVTKLSLLLKVLEEESGETLNKNWEMFHERALPDLDSNVRCGNSLIGLDFFDGQLALAEEDQTGPNAFDWQNEFPEILRAGGFDAIIGNPPWGASFSEPELAYLRNRYSRVVSRMIDSYIYFIDRSIQLAKNRGLIGLIVPSTILNQVDATPVRKLLVNRGLTALVSLGQGIFGNKVLNTSTIFVSCGGQEESFVLSDLSRLQLDQRPGALDGGHATAWMPWKKVVAADPHATFFVGQLDSAGLLQRLRNKHPPLSKFIVGSIQRGVSPDIVSAHVLSMSEAKSLRIERQLLRTSISGSQVKRYRDWTADQFILYTSRDTHIKDFPRALKFLERFRGENTCREVKEGKHPWWCLHRPRDPQIFSAPKFIGLTTSKTIELVYDPDSSLYVTDAMYVFNTVRNVDPWAFMAIMQSRLFLFLYRISNQGESRVIPQVKASKLDVLPFPACDKPHPLLKQVSDQCKHMYDFHRAHGSAKTPHEKSVVERQIDVIDHQIDRLVYDLYGLTEGDIKIVETSGVAN